MILDVLQILVRFCGLGCEYCCTRRVSLDLLPLMATQATAFQKKDTPRWCGLTYINLAFPAVAQPSGLDFG